MMRRKKDFEQKAAAQCAARGAQRGKYCFGKYGCSSFQDFIKCQSVDSFTLQINSHILKIIHMRSMEVAIKIIKKGIFNSFFGRTRNRYLLSADQMDEIPFKALHIFQVDDETFVTLRKILIKPL